MNNLILLTDSYKVTHHKQYPPGTEKVYSYFESRGGVWPKTVFFGLQYYLKKYLSGMVVTLDDVEEADTMLNLHFGTDKHFNRDGWAHIIHHHHGRQVQVSSRDLKEFSCKQWCIPTRLSRR